MNHIPDARRASSEKMVRAVGFGPVEFPATTDARTLDLKALEDSGHVAKNWTWAHKISDAVKLRYIAHALDYRAVLQLALDRTETRLDLARGGGGDADAAGEGGEEGQGTEWFGVFEDDLLLPTRPSVAADRIREALAQVPPAADALYLEWCAAVRHGQDARMRMRPVLLTHLHAHVRIHARHAHARDCVCV